MIHRNRAWTAAKALGEFEMSIERNEPIHFHEQGTLEAVTRWIATHHDGIAEWLKNVRRQYQVDRANVAENHRVAALLFAGCKERQACPHWRARRGRRHP